MIYESGDGGELNLKNNDLDTIQGLTNQIYLAWFGGSIIQSTNENLSDLEQRGDWWGNSLLNTENQFNSELEKALKTTVLNLSGLNNIENVAKKDLKYLKKYSNIEIEASLLEYNKLQIKANLIEPDGLSLKVKFLWDGTKNELIENSFVGTN